jgi:alpha-glucosidase (family GH31 glycosyl hydrolase)
MNFDIKIWSNFRKQAEIIGKHIASYKDDKGIIHMEKKDLESYIAHITVILKLCSDYMDKCGLTPPPPLWKYDDEDPTSLASSVAFIHKDKMSKKCIKAFGKTFMSEEVKPKKEKKPKAA